MSALVEKMRRAREQRVEVGGFTFTVRRPTDVEMLTKRARLAQQDVGALMDCVVGWSGVQQMHLIPGGDGAPVEFDAGVCAEWLSDRPDLLNPLAVAVLDAYQAHQKSLADAKKN